MNLTNNTLHGGQSMLKINSLSTIFVVFCLFFTHAEAYAKRKKNDFKDKTVIITDSKNIRHTAFLAKYNDKIVIVCNEDTFKIGSKITTLKDKKLSYSGIILPSPDLKREVIFIQLPEDYQNLPAFEIETQLSEKLKEGSPLKIQGCRKDKKKIGGGKGSVTAIKENRISIDSKIIFDITGAPVVSKESGRVVGVAVCKKTKRFAIAYASRIDNITKIETLNKKVVEYEIARCKTIHLAVLKYSKSFLAINKIIQDSGLNTLKKEFKHLSPEKANAIAKKLNEFKKLLTEAEKELSKEIWKLRKTPQLKIPAIKKQYEENFLRGEEIVERKFKPKIKQIDAILKKLEKRAGQFE